MCFGVGLGEGFSSVNSVFIRENFEIIYGHISWQGISRPVYAIDFPYERISALMEKTPMAYVRKCT